MPVINKKLKSLSFLKSKTIIPKENEIKHLYNKINNENPDESPMDFISSKSTKYKNRLKKFMT